MIHKRANIQLCYSVKSEHLFNCGYNQICNYLKLQAHIRFLVSISYSTNPVNNLKLSKLCK